MTTLGNIELSQPNKSYFETFCDPDMDLQKPFDAAVITPSLLRPALKAAIQSVFKQERTGRIQMLIGVDKPQDSEIDLSDFVEGRPSNVSVSFFYPGYSTSVRHGGLHPACDGGTLRCMLSYMANSRYLAYLDDDNWWAKNHLADLKSAIKNNAWAYSLRWYVHPESLHPICIDEWESVGPDKGVFKKKFGGFVDPNCLMVNKSKTDTVLRLWNIPPLLNKKGMAADRGVFAGLCRISKGNSSLQASSYYVLDPLDENHQGRLGLMGQAYDKAASP